MHPRPDTCKCGKMRQPVFNYTNYKTGERFKFCYYCDAHETPEDRAWGREAEGQYKPAYRPGANL